MRKKSFRHVIHLLFECDKRSVRFFLVFDRVCRWSRRDTFFLRCERILIPCLVSCDQSDVPLGTCFLLSPSRSADVARSHTTFEEPPWITEWNSAGDEEADSFE